MAGLSWKARRRLALVVLVVGLPVYIVVAMNAAVWLGRPHVLVELTIYAGLGVLWALPLRWLFKGVSQPDPGRQRDD